MKNKPILTIFILIAIFQIFLGGGRLQSIISQPLDFIFLMLALLIALVIHEFAHALTADRLGDPNPRVAGRVSLNPARHLDPWGTILILTTGFGWGKPVQFDPYNLKDPTKDGALIAAAGPFSNILIALICALIIRFVTFPQSTFFLSVFYFLLTLFTVNLSLAIFNLLPVYPLDGHHLLRALLTPRLRASYDLFNRSLGMIVAFLLIIPLFGPAPVTFLITPALTFFQKIFLGL